MEKLFKSLMMTSSALSFSCLKGTYSNLSGAEAPPFFYFGVIHRIHRSHTRPPA